MTSIVSLFRSLCWTLAFSAASGLAVAANAQTLFAAANAAVVSTEQVRAELMVFAPDGVQSGATVWVGLQLAHIPHWHTYWKNPGDSGLPTTLVWTLPEGVSASDVSWPLPVKIPIGNLANYGYEGTVLLPVRLTIGPSFKASVLSPEIDIGLKAAWLVCKTECIPQEGEFRLKVPLRSSSATHAPLFDAALRAGPRPLPVSAKDTVVIEPQAITLRVQGLPGTLHGKTLAFFPETPEVIETAARWTQNWDGGVWTARVPLSAQRSASPTVLPVVLAAGEQSYRVEAAVQGTWPTVAAAGPVARSSNTVAELGLSRAPTMTLWAALAGALVGGLILNLMPCVFPVLAIKVLGFARHGSNRRAHRISGFAYTAGVMLSFLALGGLMLALRGAGENLGWGFQLQDPAIVATLAALFTVLGLNLAGVFDFGSVLPSSVATLQARHPAADALLSGVLAVAIAAPCTAPFMGASLGLAIGLPAPQALAIFGALGFGMAAPYLLASLVPAFARQLPRPGPWMIVFRRLMAFPMFATVAWLVWVLGQQSGIDGAGALLALLVALAMASWALALTGRPKAWLGALSIGGLALLLWGLGPYVTRPVDVVQHNLSTGWQAWEPGLVEQITAKGQPVFVDFTAAWCVTCQYNKKSVLGDAELLADFADRKVALLRADWTRRDPAITAALRNLGRNGVPVYVLYQSGRAPVLLSEILSVQDVRAILARM